MAVRAKGSLYLRRKKDSKQPTQASGSSTSAAQRENAPQKNFAYQDGQPRQNAAATLTRPPRSFTSRLPVPIGTAKYTVEIQRPGKVGLESSVRKSHHKTRASPEQKRHSPRRRTEVSMRDYTDNFTTTSSSSPPSSSASSSWPREICTRSASPESPRRHTNRKVVPKPPHFGLEGHDQRTSQHDRDIAALKAKYLSAMKEREALSALENRVEHILKARWKREAGDVFEDAWNINSSRDPRDDRRQASDRPRESKAEDVTDTETFLSSLRKRFPGTISAEC
ncbi:uncharacterized protein EV422DRAFT_362966 [Fimicolochytrium jonesii]|uniref:uncharacterized protein n=1 Tax=Fimicolochytrium jonesii TaxID=1396493 RepID=UPI0022FE1B45|nr:uncharacterized protein EV422DRAFT_362966 [Fimicolochytrium jonesii]KAI8823629.1 hypothetical protein EV422DRAFT_362966 [Fimicolochytrium jonesii]